MIAISSVLISAGAGPPLAATDSGASTPTELVSAYDSLADTILAAKKTERGMVHSILSMTYRHAEATAMKARAMIQGGQDCREEIEKLAALVSQLGNEGDAKVAAVRKRLVEGGHHHNAAGERQGLYDEGFVIVTRAAKKVFLDAAARIGKMASSPAVGSLDAEWQIVDKQYRQLEGAAR